jgi:hypothetical protein
MPYLPLYLYLIVVVALVALHNIIQSHQRLSKEQWVKVTLAIIPTCILALCALMLHIYGINEINMLQSATNTVPIIVITSLLVACGSYLLIGIEMASRTPLPRDIAAISWGLPLIIGIFIWRAI